MYVFISVLLLFYSAMTICVADFQKDIEYEIEGVSTTERFQESTFQMPDDKWTSTALKDVSYYLRNYKFNEWDRRYYNEKRNSGSVGYFGSFPVPPLRTLHWKVYGNCNSDFYKCLIYLHSVVITAPFTRSDDTSIVLNNNSLQIEDNSITSLDIECKKALLNSEKSGLPFDCPVEYFQWRTSASYYMCWYTMLGTPPLSMLGEACDNFAHCLEPIYGHHNRDIRSDDRLPFACAMYSFCPDPCCPIRHLESLSQCNDLKTNPCYIENTGNESSERRCTMERTDNQNFNDIIANRWNVSCYCKEKGFTWKSRFGICVDINECNTGYHNCNNVTEDCLNLPGTFHCVCKYRFAFDKEINKCVKVITDTESNENYNTQGFTLLNTLSIMFNNILFTK